MIDGLKGSRETRDALLDATDRLLARVGFRKMTMDDVAREAGFSRRSVYTYFPSKEEVGLSSIDRVVARTHEHLRELAAEIPDPAACLRRLLIERVLFRIDSIRDYRQSLDELFEAVRPAYMLRRKRQHGAEAELFAGVLEAGRARGCFAFDDSMATAITLIRATNAFLPYSLSVAELGEREEIAAGVTRMAELLLRGLAAGARAKPLNKE
jgi:AcrR family transcriptional regulator